MINFRYIEKIRADYEAGHFSHSEPPLNPKDVASAVGTLLEAFNELYRRGIVAQKALNLAEEVEPDTILFEQPEIKES